MDISPYIICFLIFTAGFAGLILFEIQLFKFEFWILDHMKKKKNNSTKR